MSFTAIIPKNVLNPQQQLRAIQNTLDGAAAGALVDFKTTVATWTHKPGFTIDNSQPDRRIVGTDDQIYAYVNDGTKAHTIRARGKGRLRFQAGYRAKTSPGVIGSRGGGASGPVVYARVVRHPGTRARQLTKAIAEKWQRQLPILMSRAIAAEVS